MFKRLKNGSLHVKGQVVDCGLLLNGRWHIVMDTGMHFSAPRVDSDKISLTLDGFYTHELCGKSYKKIWNQVNKIVNNN